MRQVESGGVRPAVFEEGASTAPRDRPASFTSLGGPGLRQASHFMRRRRLGRRRYRSN
ncbi:hypothetical protein ACWEJ6_13500 [Nonomuraea sp. NPDC004702]